MYDDSLPAPSIMGESASLHEVRLEQVRQRLRASGARRVLDLGCGSGQLLYRLAGEQQFEDIVGLEVCSRSLRQAREMLADYHRGAMARVTLLNGSYTRPQPSLVGFDAAAMVETIEHIHPESLSAAEQAVFGQMRPRRIYLTTPNREYNPLFGLRPGEFREPDHKFEWDRGKFSQWALGVARRNGYRVRLGGIGEADPELGHPTQTAWFSRCD